MKKLAYTSILFALLTSTAIVQAQAPQRQGAGPAARISTSIPASSMTVTHWYKQNVYDPGDNKIGEIKDVLVDRDGKITALIVGAGAASSAWARRMSRSHSTLSRSPARTTTNGIS